MIENRKLTEYETRMLASAYNLSNYCKNTQCVNCIFKAGSYCCIINADRKPVEWRLDRVDKEVNPLTGEVLF